MHLRDRERRQQALVGCIRPGLQGLAEAVVGRGDEAVQRNRCTEGAEGNEGAPIIGVERHHADGAEVDLDRGRGRARPAFDAIDAHPAGYDEQLVATCRVAAEDHVGSLGHHRLPLGGRLQGGPDTAAIGRITGGDADQPLAVEVQAGLCIDTFDDGGPRAGGGIEQVDVDLRPLHHHLHQHIAAVAADGDVGPRLRGGLAIEGHRVVGVIGADDVETDVAVVLVALGVRRVPEARIVGQPGDAGGSRVGDALIEDATAGNFHHVQHAVLGAALAEPVGHEQAILRRLEPVDGHRRVEGERCRVEQGASRHGGVGGATQDKRELVGAGCAFEHEEVIAGDRERQRCGQRRERGEALVPPAPGGPSSERLARSAVVCCHPFGDFRGFAVLQPPIRVGHLDAVIDVGLRTSPGGGCRGYGCVSHAPCSDAYRGWPCCDAGAPCASWSSST